jgi:ribosomal protein L37AE/L43A
MICPKCGDKGVENSALGKKFWYCRTCKDEIGLTPKPKDPPPSWLADTDFAAIPVGLHLCDKCGYLFTDISKHSCYIFKNKLDMKAQDFLLEHDAPWSGGKDAQDE